MNCFNCGYPMRTMWEGEPGFEVAAGYVCMRCGEEVWDQELFGDDLYNAYMDVTAEERQDQENRED